jgi:hypothetical protein
VAWPDMTEISLSAAYSPGAIRPSPAPHEPGAIPDLTGRLPEA